ncbi:B12-binding domain-containing radical SAM protein [bacterium]|nr:B12-binding domain-containing radical SAM protein [bacterium]
MINKRILIIQPSPYATGTFEPITQKKLYLPGLAPVLLSALIPSDYKVDIVYETIEKIPFENKYGLILISSMGHTIVRAIDIALKFKKLHLESQVVFGGYMASLMVDECLKHVDTVVVGDGEESLKQLISDYEKGQLKRVYDNPLSDLSDLPAPDYKTLSKKSIGDWMPVFAGRGCPNVCSFCSVYCVYRGRYIRRPVKDVLRDVREIKKLGYSKILLLDDNIMSEPEYMFQLTRELKREKIKWMGQCDIRLSENDELLDAVKESGCVGLSFGIESISQLTLNSLNKSWARVSDYRDQIKKIAMKGICVSTEMVLGGEGDSMESIIRTEEFIRKSYIIAPRFYILTPIPGTDFYKEMKAAGRIICDDIYSYNGSFAVHKPTNIPPDILTREYWKLYDRLFSISAISQRIVKHVGKIDPGALLFFSAVNMVYRSHIKRRITPNIV